MNRQRFRQIHHHLRVVWWMYRQSDNARKIISRLPLTWEQVKDILRITEEPGLRAGSTIIVGAHDPLEDSIPDLVNYGWYHDKGMEFSYRNHSRTAFYRTLKLPEWF